MPALLDSFTPPTKPGRRGGDSRLDQKVMGRPQTRANGTVLRGYFMDPIEKSDLSADRILVRSALPPALAKVASGYFVDKMPYPFENGMVNLGKETGVRKNCF